MQGQKYIIIHHLYLASEKDVYYVKEKEKQKEEI